MTEAEWLSCNNSLVMLSWRGICSKRKDRLFGCACVQRVQHLLTDTRSLTAIEVSERFADGRATQQEMDAAATAALTARDEGMASWDEDHLFAADAAFQAAREDSLAAAQAASWAVASHSRGIGHRPPAKERRQSGERTELKQQAKLLRCILGNPFRPSIVDDRWSGWNGGLVPALADSIYEERRYADLRILADALEEAGCTNADILSHCRGPGPHVRGCWVIDLILGKQ